VPPVGASRQRHKRFFNAPCTAFQLNTNQLILNIFLIISRHAAAIEMTPSALIIVRARGWYAPSRCIFLMRSLNMLGYLARWGHNILLAGMALLTIALVVLAR
jgi:hypothetical protein